MYRDTVDIMDAVYRDAVHRRQRRDEESSCSPLPSSTAVSSALTLPRSGVGLFEDAADVLFPQRAPKEREPAGMPSPAFRVSSGHTARAHSRRYPFLRSSGGGHLRFQTCVRKFHTGVQRAGHVIGKNQDFYHRLRCASFLFLGYTVPGWLLCPNYIGTPRPLKSRRAPFCVSFLNNIFLCRFILPPAAKFPLCFLSFMHKIMPRHRSGLAVLNGCLKINHLRYDPFCFIFRIASKQQ